MKLKYKTIIFDLDGTLLDTIEDITICVNKAIENNGFSVNYSFEQCKKFIGSGARELIHRATAVIKCSKDVEDNIFNDYMDLYKIHRNDNAKPFLEVVETLKELKCQGAILGVISNKPEQDTIACINRYFFGIFDFVVGGKKDVPVKPNPFVFYLLKDKYGFKECETLYVGDMIYDIEFAKNAKIDVAIYRYGYGNFNKQCGNYYIESLKDLISIEEGRYEKTI